MAEDGELVQAVEAPNEGNLCCGELKFQCEPISSMYNTTAQITQFSLS